MRRESDADRIARERAEAARNSAAKERQHAASIPRRNPVEETRTEISRVLRFMATHDYPGIQQVYVGATKWRKKPIYKGGWLIDSYWLIRYADSFDKDEHGIWLMSDGRLKFGGCDPQDAASPIPSHVPDGHSLSDLLEKLRALC